MILIFDENFSHNFADAFRLLEKSNKTGGKQAEIYDIVSLGKELQFTMESGAYTDEQVIQIAGKKRGTLITMDNDFKVIKSYYKLYAENGIGVVHVKTDNKNHWNTIVMIINNWNQMKKLVSSSEPPFCFTINQRGIEKKVF